MADDDVQQLDGTEPPVDDASQETSGDAGQPAALSAEDIAQLRRDAAQARASQQRADRVTKELERYQAAERQAQLDAAGEDGKLQVELKQERALREAAEQKLVLAQRQAAYPNAAKSLGDHIATLPEEAVAGLEATLAATAEVEPPTPKVHNEAKGTNPATGGAKKRTADDVRAELRAMNVEGWEI